MDRILLLAAFCLLICVLIVAGRWIARRRLKVLRTAEPLTLWHTLNARPDGRATVVAFSSPSCAVCHGVQARALMDTENEFGRESVRVVHVDIAERPDVARVFGVMTVPTTVVLTPHGAVADANHGLALGPKLIQQVRFATIG